MKAFKALGAAVNIDVSSSTQRIALGQASPDVRMMNNGTATIWFEFGGSAVTATLAASHPLGPGVTEVWGIPDGTTHVAAIASAGTGKVYGTPGIGL